MTLSRAIFHVCLGGTFITTHTHPVFLTALNSGTALYLVNMLNVTLASAGGCYAVEMNYNDVPLLSCLKSIPLLLQMCEFAFIILYYIWNRVAPSLILACYSFIHHFLHFTCPLLALLPISYSGATV